MIEKICKIYNYFYCEVSGFKNYTFKPNEQQRKMISNFIKKKSSQIGDEWLFDYFVFQFNRYYDKKTRFGVGVVQLGWVLGDKALQRWAERIDGEVFHADNFRANYNLKNPLIEPLKLILSEDYFDSIRKRDHFLECLTLDLYKEKNMICRFCKHKSLCNSVKTK